jgi:Flp pilus assembly protein TadG
MFMMAGASVDIGRVMLVKSEMQSTLDAAILASGREFQSTGDEATAKTTLDGYFSYRFKQGEGKPGNPKITHSTVDPSKYTVTATAEATVATPFLGMVGIKSMPVKTLSTATLSIGGTQNDKALEISLMLDVTGSMAESDGSGSTKIESAKLAAKDLVKILLPDGYQNDNPTRVALVPFSQYVNVGSTVYKKVTGLNASGSKTCVTERTGVQAYTDAEPVSGARIGVFTSSSNHGSLSCAPTAKLIPLTKDRQTLESAIDGFSANGWTAGHLGTAWAWYALSHNWDNIWPSESAPAAAGPNVRKVAVLMTDGDYNTYYRNATESQDQATNLCSGMKAADITVYTIGFGTGMSQSTKDFLKSCASSAETYFDAVDGNTLKQVFRTIAYNLSNLRLTQ